MRTTPVLVKRPQNILPALLTAFEVLVFAAGFSFGALRFLTGLRDAFLLEYLPYVFLWLGGLSLLTSGVKRALKKGERKALLIGVLMGAAGLVCVGFALPCAIEDGDLFERFLTMLTGLLIMAVVAALFLLWLKKTGEGALFGKFYQRHPMIPLIVPAALLIYFVYISLGWNAWVSVSDWQSGNLEASYGFGGFGQYAAMFGSEYFWPSLKNTLLLFCLIPLCLALGLGLALLMDQGLHGSTLFRNLILLPFSLSFVVTGTVWAWMYRPTGGVLNSFLQIFGVDTKNLMWAASNDTVMLSIIIALVWQFSGYVAVIFLAGIKAVPENIINAAKLDGAYSPRIYRRLIIPRLKGAMGSCITILAMYALRSFDFIVSLVGYTKTSAWTMPVWMYYETFQKNNFALGAAISCFLLALVLALILPLTVWSNKRR